ncbi:hypothetical protein CL614_04225 [archaeon]|nr:hypothetical protein [archaeon]|tara:strand:+ start:494 stop:1021 length:528 start_codon:yes stop_codon:yes gene_type:complete
MIFDKIKANARDKKRQKYVLKFLMKFLILAIPLYAIMIFGLSIPALQANVAVFITWFLNLTGVPATVSGIMITLPEFAGYIAWDCIGWKSIIAFIGLISATHIYNGKQFWGKKRYLGFALIPVIFVVNLVRIWFMFFIASIDVDLYFLLHDIVWSWGLILLVLILWVLWFKRIQN